MNERASSAQGNISGQFNSRHSILLFRVVGTAYLMSIFFSQWYYAGITEGTLKSVIPKNMTSILVISLGFIILTITYRISHSRESSKSLNRELLVLASLSFAITTCSSIMLGAWISGVNSETVEGLKSLAATLMGLLLIKHFVVDMSFFLRIYAIIFGLVVIYSFVQTGQGINWQTSNSFFTIGASERWWDLNSTWGPFALSGKNVYGMALVLSFSLLSPHLFLSNVFGRIEKAILATALLASGYLIFVSRSRTSILLLATNVLILFLFFSWMRRNFLPFFIMLILLPSFGFILVAGNFDWLFSSRSAAARGLSFNAAVLSPQSNYLFGSGYDSIFRLTASTFGNSLSQAGKKGVNVDNYYLRRFLEGGLLGLFSFLSVLLALFKSYLDTKILSGQQRVWGCCALLIFIDIGFASTSGDFLSFQIVNCIFFLCIAFIAAGLRLSDS